MFHSIKYLKLKKQASIFPHALANDTNVWNVNNVKIEILGAKAASTWKERPRTRTNGTPESGSIVAELIHYKLLIRR